MKLKGVMYYAIILGFLGWCVIAFKADLAKITFTPILAAWHMVLLAGLLSLVNYLLRIIKWTLYLTRLGHPLKFGFSALTYVAGFAFTLSPGKVGEMVRGRYLKNVGVSFSNTAAAFFVERLLDLLSMIAMVCIAIGSSTYNTLMWGAVITIALIMVTLALAPWNRLSLWAHTLVWLPKSLNHIVQTVFQTLLSARQLLHPGVLLSGFLLGIVAWSCEGTGLMLLSNIFTGNSISLQAAIGTYSIATIVGALSFLPGGLGSTEAVMIAMLNKYGHPISEAILITMVFRLLTLWLAVAIGWLAVFALNAKKKPEICLLDQDMHPTPLCVDLDGTLIHTDLLLETSLLLIKRNPLYVLLLPVWLLKGKAACKAEIARRVELNVVVLPYNTEFIDWLRVQHQAGRQLWLCTASNYRLANAVAEHMGFFSGVIASSDTHNLSGRNKARQLVEKFGDKAFDYCGNNRVDMAIWRVSQGAVVVNGNEHLRKNAETVSTLRAVFPKTGGLFKPVFKALRLHQWAKNVLVIVPLAAAHKLGDMVLIEQAVLAFLAFGLCASSVYLLNDMLDLEVDRQHPRKCKRPFASGKLSLLTGFLLIPLLLLATILIAASLPLMFGLILAAYYALTVAYSFGLKRVVLMDTITLAGLYTIRIVAGAMAISVPLSFWLLLFSVFLFLSLALVKRYAELDSMQRQGKLKAAGRGYHTEDLPILHSLGTASGYLCVLVLALYINSPAVEALYHHPKIIWFLCVLLLYWISRMWLTTHRGKMYDDPVIFALRDKASQIVGLLAAVDVILAI
jgi:uncharacterized protein (TIRG00374 family)